MYQDEKEKFNFEGLVVRWERCPTPLRQPIPAGVSAGKNDATQQERLDDDQRAYWIIERALRRWEKGYPVRVAAMLRASVYDSDLSKFRYVLKPTADTQAVMRQQGFKNEEDMKAAYYERAKALVFEEWESTCGREERERSECLRRLGEVA